MEPELWKWFKAWKLETGARNSFSGKNISNVSGFKLMWSYQQGLLYRSLTLSSYPDLQVHLHHPNECLRLWRRIWSGRTSNSSSFSRHHEPQLSGALSDQMSDQNIHYNDNQVNTRICQRFDHSVCVRAVRDIAAGEEVTNRWSQYENNVISWLETVVLLL